MFSSAEKLASSGYLVRFTRGITRKDEGNVHHTMGSAGAVHYFHDWRSLKEWLNRQEPLHTGTGLYIEATEVVLQAV